jgi:hypothetical protein
MSKAEPTILAIILGMVVAMLVVRLTVGRYMAANMAPLDCRRGYYGLMSLATSARPAVKAEENADWIAIKAGNGHFLFSKPSLRAHPMVVRRRLAAAGRGFNLATEGCAFGDRRAYKEAMANLPPAVKAAPERGGGVQLKVMLNQ